MVLLNVEELLMFAITNRNKVVLAVWAPYIVLNVYLLMVVHMTDLNDNAQVVAIPVYIGLEA